MEVKIYLVLVAVIVMLSVGCLITYRKLKKAHEANRKLEDRIVYLELELLDSAAEVRSLNDQFDE